MDAVSSTPTSSAPLGAKDYLVLVVIAERHCMVFHGDLILKYFIVSAVTTLVVASHTSRLAS